MLIYSIPGKLDVTWNNEVKAVIDTWTTYDITLEEFKEAVLIKGVEHAKMNGAIAWIVDSSKAKGAFPQEVQDFIGSDVFPTFAKIGIKYFITITSTVSAITKMSVSTYAAKVGPCGIKLLELNSAIDAIVWLKSNANKRI